MAADNSSMSSEVLDQSEIDRLLAQAIEPPKQHVYRADGRKMDAAAAPKIDLRLSQSGLPDRGGTAAAAPAA